MEKATAGTNQPIQCMMVCAGACIVYNCIFCPAGPGFEGYFGNEANKALGGKDDIMRHMICSYCCNGCYVCAVHRAGKNAARVKTTVVVNGTGGTVVAAAGGVVVQQQQQQQQQPTAAVVGTVPAVATGVVVKEAPVPMVQAVPVGAPEAADMIR